MRARVTAAVRLLAVLAVAGLAVSGCSASDGIAGDYASGGSSSGTVSADGAYLELEPSQRDAPIEFSGATIDGGTVDSADLLGSITVVNFWYAGCPPCRVEAPSLASLSTELDDVAFVGVNIYDTAEVADAFDREFGIDYPSILDANSGAVQLAFAGQVATNAVPTTIVLDTDGRVAARISGVIRDPAILLAMIETVQERG